MEEIKRVARPVKTPAKHTVNTPIELDNKTYHIPDAPLAKRRFQRIKITKNNLIKFLPIAFGIVSICTAFYLYISWRQSIPPPLPDDVISSLHYQVYYPSRMPYGYRLKKDSATSHNGLLFFKFISGKKVITVTEQAAPPKNVDLSKLTEGYTSIKAPAGKAAAGSSVGNPSVMIITDTTMVNITSSKGVTKDQVIQLAQKMNVVEPIDSL